MQTPVYPYIRAWGHFMGSYAYYINDQVVRAAQDKAPRNAIYERDGVWVTFDDVTNRRAVDSVKSYFESRGWDL